MNMRQVIDKVIQQSILLSHFNKLEGLRYAFILYFALYNDKIYISDIIMLQYISKWVQTLIYLRKIWMVITHDGLIIQTCQQKIIQDILIYLSYYLFVYWYFQTKSIRFKIIYQVILIAIFIVGIYLEIVNYSMQPSLDRSIEQTYVSLYIFKTLNVMRDPSGSFIQRMFKLLNECKRNFNSIVYQEISLEYAQFLLQVKQLTIEIFNVLIMIIFSGYLYVQNKIYIIKYNKYIKIINNILTITVVVLFSFLSIIQVQNNLHVNGIMPAWGTFLLNNKRYTIGNKQLQSLTKQYRQSVTLPDDYDWLFDANDQNPLFPLVKAHKYTVCSYNKQKDYCPSIKFPNQINNPPNIVFLVIESFQPDLLDTNYIISNQTIYNKEQLPNIYNLAIKGLTLSQLSSNGNPTSYGLLSLFTGIIPSKRNYNIINDVYNKQDDIFSFMRANNYYTLYSSPDDLQFDAQGNWVFRGLNTQQIYKIRDLSVNNTQKHSYEFLQKHPRWLDSVIYHNKTVFCKDSWMLPDKFQLQYFYERILNIKKTIYKPFFALAITADTHSPFSGLYCNQDPYSRKNKHRITQSLIYNGSDTNIPQQTPFKRQKYLQQLKQTDELIGSFVNKIKKLDPNTILVVTGDHPAKISSTTKKSLKLTQSNLFGPELFRTSALITYLGNDKQIKQIFKKSYGKSLNIPLDHQDLIFTLQKIINPLMPSARAGRDIFELFNTMEANKILKKHISIRQTQIHTELATQDKIFRLNNYLQDGFVFNGIQTQLSEFQELERINYKEKHFINDISNYFETLNSQNRLFDYQLRNIQCIKQQNCSFNGRKPPQIFHETLLWRLLLGFLIFLLIIFDVFHTVQKTAMLIGLFVENIMKRIFRFLGSQKYISR